MKKIYLNGKRCPPGWDLECKFHPDIVKEDGQIVAIIQGRVEMIIRTFWHDIPVRQIYNGWNSVHYVTKKLVEEE